MWFLYRLVAVCGGAFLLTTVPASALGVGPWSPPVSGPVVKGFDPPRSPFGPGHLGVDYAVAPGTAVRAAGDGVVVFAGRVGEGLHVVVRHDGDVRTTDSFLATIVVVAGEAVERGAVLGTSGGTGPAHDAGVLHFGVRVGSTPVDPMLLFAPPDLSAVVHLAAPRGGAAAAADPSPPGAAGEWAALADEVRVDARLRSAPPPWWHEMRSGPRPQLDSRASPALRAPATRQPASTSTAGSTAAAVAVAAISAGGLSAARRRRRSRAS